MRCRGCENEATVAIRSGFEWHPTCDECAAWWPRHRWGKLSLVSSDYGRRPGDSRWLTAVGWLVFVLLLLSFARLVVMVVERL